jgi:hypothetical protein
MIGAKRVGFRFRMSRRADEGRGKNGSSYPMGDER